MANNLGSLGEFEIDPNKPHDEIVGMARARGYEGGNKPPTIVKGKVIPAEPERKVRVIPEPVPISELLRNCEAALANYEKHHVKRDCSALEAQLRNELLPQLLGHHVAAEIARAIEVLRCYYDPRWQAKAYLRTDAHKFHTVAEARKCYLRLVQARGRGLSGSSQRVTGTLQPFSRGPVCSRGLDKLGPVRPEFALSAGRDLQGPPGLKPAQNNDRSRKPLGLRAD